MKKTIILVILFIVFAFPHTVRAEETDIDTVIENNVDMFNMDETDNDLKKITSKYDMGNFSLKDTALKIISGEYDFSMGGIVKEIIKLICGQATEVIYIMRKIIIIILLSAILEMLTSSFSSAGVGKLGQYICSAVLIITIMQSFYFAAKTAVEAVNNIEEISKTLQPLYVLIMTAEGKITKMTVSVPVLYGAATTLNSIVSRFVVPLILFAALITFINSMSERDILMEFADLLSTVCKFSVKACAGVFVFIMSLIKIGVPDTAIIAGKTIKTAVEAVPIAGNLLSSAAETVTGITMSMGNSITAAIMIFIAIMSIIPVVRLGVIMLVYKFTAAAVQPVASKRIVKCISQAADYTAILMGIVFTAEIMFIVVTAIMLSV